MNQKETGGEGVSPFEVVQYRTGARSEKHGK
jgi:hypothetical protein